MAVAAEAHSSLPHMYEGCLCALAGSGPQLNHGGFAWMQQKVPADGC
jgi:hypothetical protein